jgi:glycolate oxidase FAD binding subunit
VEGGYVLAVARADCPAVRAAVDVFAPEAPASRALAKRVKESFDPKGMLNPGRMWAGI